jgi:acetyltransferase-like isoleucine patch superfamily enzyme
VKDSKIRDFLGAPFSNKVAVLKRLYWRVKTRVYYGVIFKSIGHGSVICRPMLIYNADCIEIADNVSIRDGVRLEAVRDPFGRTPLLTIGSNTLIEQSVQIVCHCRVAIGCDVSIAGHCAIVDVTHPYKDISVANIGFHIANDDSYVEIGDGVFLGYGTVILPNVRIGDRAVVGANSVVTRDVPPLSIVAGAPARVVKIYSHELQRWVEPDHEPGNGDAAEL